MNDSARLFYCAACRQPCLVCRRCDHGQRYCRGCAHEARLRSVRAAGARYQHSRRGRFKHAARQLAYRLRHSAQKVTHHGSLALPAAVSSSASVTVAVDRIPSLSRPAQMVLRCHFCGHAVSAWLRREPLRRAAPSRYPAHPRAPPTSGR